MAVLHSLVSPSWPPSAPDLGHLLIEEAWVDTCLDNEKRPTVLRRITGSFKSVPEPLDITETRTRKRESVQDNMRDYRLILISGKYAEWISPPCCIPIERG